MEAGPREGGCSGWSNEPIGRKQGCDLSLSRWSHCKHRHLLEALVTTASPCIIHKESCENKPPDPGGDPDRPPEYGQMFFGPFLIWADGFIPIRQELSELIC